MCLAIPLQVMSIDGSLARVGASGLELTAALDLVEGVGVGDYVLVHAGYAIQALTAQQARETLEIFEKTEGSAGTPP